MRSATLIRAAALYLPVAGTLTAWLLRRPAKRQVAAALLAGAWCIVWLLPINLIAPRLGWWRFHAQGGLFISVPAELYLGWALLWGPIAALACGRVSLLISIASFAVFDVLLMPLAKPVLVLDHGWLVGEAVSISLCLVPAQLLARWTESDVRVQKRAALQAIAFTGLTVGVVPALIATLTSAPALPMLGQPMWHLSLSLQILAIPGLIGLTAVQEFAHRGHGTPLPYDPPVRLVTTGLYRYIANPMQLAMSLTFLCCGGVLRSRWIAAAGFVSFAYGAGIARWSEDNDMADRFGEAWAAYRCGVRAWAPRWHPLNRPPGIIYIAGGCEVCRGVGAWIKRRNPTALTIAAAELHPSRRLNRITYECEGYEDEGVAGLARALEHINFAWALAGCAMRLPVIRGFLQLVADAAGGGPTWCAWTPHSDG